MVELCYTISLFRLKGGFYYDQPQLQLDLVRDLGRSVRQWKRHVGTCRGTDHRRVRPHCHCPDDRRRVLPRRLVPLGAAHDTGGHRATGVGTA